MEYSHDWYSRSVVNSFLESRISEITSIKSCRNRCYTRLFLSQLIFHVMTGNLPFIGGQKPKVFTWILSFNRLFSKLLLLDLFQCLSNKKIRLRSKQGINLWTCCAEPLFLPLGVKDIAWLPDHDVVRDRRLRKAGQGGDVPRATCLKS